MAGLLQCMPSVRIPRSAGNNQDVARLQQTSTATPIIRLSPGWQLTRNRGPSRFGLRINRPQVSYGQPRSPLRLVNRGDPQNRPVFEPLPRQAL